MRRRRSAGTAPRSRASPAPPLLAVVALVSGALAAVGAVGLAGSRPAGGTPRLGPPAAADGAVTAVTGGACGFFVDVGLFGGPRQRQGCGQPDRAPATAASPSVTLPPGGSDTAVTASDPDGGRGDYGPAAIFGGISPAEVQSTPSSGPISVSTQGTPEMGTVESSAHITLHPAPKVVACATRATPAPTPACLAPGGFGGLPVEGQEAHVTCTASSTAVTGTTTFKGARHARATRPDGDPDPLQIEAVPDRPPVNYTRSGVITNVGDVFTAVYNEQIVGLDGFLTVNAVHMYLFGPTAVGEVVKGQARCGVSPSPRPTRDSTPPGCGRRVVAPVSPQNPSPRVPRTELIGVFDAGGLASIENVQVVNGTVATGQPDGLAYLRFAAGQTGPLAMTATRTDESRPMSWSFDARDAAGNLTRSSTCPTDSPEAGPAGDPVAAAAAPAAQGEGRGGWIAGGVLVLSTVPAAAVILLLRRRGRRRAAAVGNGERS